MQFCLLDASYEVKERPVIKLFGVDEKGKSILVLDDYQPYFYVLPKNKNKIKERLRTIKIVEDVKEEKRKLGLDEKEFLKIFVDLPQNVPEVRDSIKNSPFVDNCYEYSINFYKRYLMDKKFYPSDWLKIAGEEIKSKEGHLFDTIIKAKKILKIEKEEITKIKILAFDIEVVNNEIIMISVADNSGYKKLLTWKKARQADISKNEKEMLERFEKTVNERNPDIIVTYNGDMYDFEVLRERCEELKVDMNISRDLSSVKFERRAHMSSARLFGRVHIDLFNFVNNILSPQLPSEVFTLNEVAKELIDEGKEELSLEDIIQLWKCNPDKLAEYCQHDSLLTLKLSQNILPQIFELSKISGQLPFDCSRLTYGLLAEWFLVRKSAELGYISPNQPHWKEIQKRRMLRPYRGGYVKEPKAGLHNDIAVFDFRSLYPSIIVTYNISPETLNCKCCKGYKVPGSKNYFCKKRQGFVSRLVKELIESRREIKEKMKSAKSDNVRKQLDEEQKAVKIVANASYGMMAYVGAKWYCRECAEASAAFGRENIKKSITIAEKYGFDVLYGDTDSLFVKLKRSGNIRKAAKEFLNKINKKLLGIIELELQGIYEKGIFVPQKIGGYTAKKRYALIDKDGNLLVRGLETVRRDWCDIARSLQHDVLRLVLMDKEKQAVTKVREIIERIKKRKVDMKDIAVRTQLGKELEEYKAIAPHIAVAKRLEKEGHEVRAGMVLSYIITKKKGSVSDKAESTDKVSIKDYDIDYYLNKQVIPVALRVLQVLGYKEDDFLKKESLKKFVKK